MSNRKVHKPRIGGAASLTDYIARALTTCVAPPNERGCSVWLGALSADGYGRFKWSGRYYYAARVVLELKLGRELRNGFVSLHSCDNPPCVTAEHLREGTNGDNQREAYARGLKRRPTWVSGEQNGNARLTATDVLEIRSLAEAHRPEEIAARFAISPSHVVNICARHRWRHVE